MELMLWYVLLTIAWLHYHLHGKMIQLIYGSNNSLYHKLFAAGLLGIDSITTARCWVLVYKKNDFSFPPVYRISKDLNDRILFGR